MTEVVCIGECMVEFRATQDGRYELGFAGDAFNTAVYLKRSAPELTVRFLTATGVDRFSAAMRATWRAEGIAEDLAFAVDAATPGLYVITLDHAGERSFTYWRSASPARHWFELLLQQGGAQRLADADLIYCSGISLAILAEEQRDPALQLLATLQQRGCKIAFDPNYRPSLWPSRAAAKEILRAAMQLADIVLPSQEDLTALGLTDLELTEGLNKRDARECVTTFGARGCEITTAMSATFLNAPSVTASEVVDTSGAGDSFNGAYLAARLMGNEPVVAAAAALAVAARVVTAAGAIVPRDISHPALKVLQ